MIENPRISNVEREIKLAAAQLKKLHVSVEIKQQIERARNVWPDHTHIKINNLQTLKSHRNEQTKLNYVAKRKASTFSFEQIKCNVFL